MRLLATRQQFLDRFPGPERNGLDAYQRARGVPVPFLVVRGRAVVNPTLLLRPVAEEQFQRRFARHAAAGILAATARASDDDQADYERIQRSAATRGQPVGRTMGRR